MQLHYFCMTLKNKWIFHYITTIAMVTVDLPPKKFKLFNYEIIKKSNKFHNSGHQKTAEIVQILGTLFINYTIIIIIIIIIRGLIQRTYPPTKWCSRRIITPVHTSFLKSSQLPGEYTAQLLPLQRI